VKPAVDLTAEKGAANRVYPKNPSQIIAAEAQSIAQIPLNMNMGAAGGNPTSGQQADHLASMMGDAPPCDGCGHTTVRNGACYKCLNCGNSMGCS
jgi:hypothetical protein